jgi:PPOX class probable F420-dependent enzyme
VTSAAFSLDEGTPFGARAARHLREDMVVWMTTVTPSGQPSPSPVWFLWDDEDRVSMYSRDSPRVRNLATNPRVALNFPGDGRGGDIVVLSGTAAVQEAAVPVHLNAEYLTKYGGAIQRMGKTPEEFSAEYRVPVQIRLSGVRGH